MPVISDLSKAAGGPEITIATLAEKFNTLPEGAKIQPFLKAIKRSSSSSPVKCDGAERCGVEIGSFELLKNRAATTTVSARQRELDDRHEARRRGGTYAPNAAGGHRATIAGKDTSEAAGDPGHDLEGQVA